MRTALSPEQRDPPLGGGGHGAVVVDGVLGHDVVLQEEALRVLLLQGVPLPGVLPSKTNRDEAPRSRLPPAGLLTALTLLGSKSSLTLKLSTTQEADRLRSTQARRSSSRASLACSILGTRAAGDLLERQQGEGERRERAAQTTQEGGAVGTWSQGSDLGLESDAGVVFVGQSRFPTFIYEPTGPAYG